MTSPFIAQEISPERKKRKPIRNMAFAVLMLTLACGDEGDTIIKANRPATVKDAYEDSDWNGALNQWQYAYYLELEQCDRSDTEVVGADGCITLAVEVDRDVFERSETNDQITFEDDTWGTLVDE